MKLSTLSIEKNIFVLASCQSIVFGSSSCFAVRGTPKTKMAEGGGIEPPLVSATIILLIF